MTILVLDYTLLITRLIRKARKRNAITSYEADHLIMMAREGFPGDATRALVSNKGAPDFTYAALYFSTLVWQVGDTRECDAEARAGYELAQFILSQESLVQDTYWATKLLRELYESHSKETQHPLECVMQRAASG